MQKCQPQCQSGNSGNFGTTDWVEFWWKWAKRNPDRDSIQWELVSCVSTKGTRGICALGFVFENTPKWGEGFTVMAHLPPYSSPSLQYFNSKNVSRLRHQLHFLFHFRQTRNTSICVATALMRFEAQAIFHTYCVLNPISGLGELRVGWSLVCKS